MNQLAELLKQCSDLFRQTPEYNILDNYRTRESRLTLDERLSITRVVNDTFAPFFKKLMADVPNFNDSDRLFYALSAQQFETIAIAECLTVGVDAIRMRKHRLRDKLPLRWIEILYPQPERNSYADVTQQKSPVAATQIPLSHQSSTHTKVMKQKLSFGKAVANCFSKYFITKGRARRSEYWYFVLFCCIVNVMYVLLRNLLDGIAYPSMTESTVDAWKSAMQFVRYVSNIGLLIPLYTVTVRRLHDRDDNGWLAILLCLLPWLVIAAISVNIRLFGDDILVQVDASTESFLKILKPFIGLSMIQFIILITKIVIFSKPGTEGPNNYGADPTIHIAKADDKQLNNQE